MLISNYISASFAAEEYIHCSDSAQRLDLFAWCARLSRLLVGFRTHFKSLSFIHSFIHFNGVASRLLVELLSRLLVSVRSHVTNDRISYDQYGIVPLWLSSTVIGRCASTFSAAILRASSTERHNLSGMNGVSDNVGIYTCITTPIMTMSA